MENVQRQFLYDIRPCYISASHSKIAPENVGLKKYKSTIHIYVIHVWNKVVAGGAGNVLPERRYTTEHDVACFWRWLPEPLVSPPSSCTACSPVTHQVCMVCSCRHALLDDPTGKSQVGSNLVTLEAIVLMKLLCLGKMIWLQPCSCQKCGLCSHLVGDNRVWVPDHLTDSQTPGRVQCTLDLLQLCQRKWAQLFATVITHRTCQFSGNGRVPWTVHEGFSLPHKRVFWEFTQPDKWNHTSSLNHV
jgi:hypothetical protein